VFEWRLADAKAALEQSVGQFPGRHADGRTAPVPLIATRIDLPCLGQPHADDNGAQRAGDESHVPQRRWADAATLRASTK
jgi:hypothetical protein